MYSVFFMSCVQQYYRAASAKKLLAMGVAKYLVRADPEKDPQARLLCFVRTARFGPDVLVEEHTRGVSLRVYFSPAPPQPPQRKDDGCDWQMVAQERP